jgi:hypothetical protein
VRLEIEGVDVRRAAELMQKDQMLGFRLLGGGVGPKNLRQGEGAKSADACRQQLAPAPTRSLEIKATGHS